MFNQDDGAARDVDPINLLAVSNASNLLSSLVMATVLLAVVGMGLTTLLNMDNLPCDGTLIVVEDSIVVLGEYPGVVDTGGASEVILVFGIAPNP